MKNRVVINLIILLGFSTGLMSQNTVGLIAYDNSNAYDGYNLLYPHNQPNVYLLNNCGEIVHEWTDGADFRPGNTVYLRNDGSIIKTKRNKNVADDAIWSGGGGGIIEIRDWENNLIWSYTLNNDSLRLHHDIAPLDNGNILAVAWELKTELDCLAAGKDTSMTANDELWSEYIFEINPTTDEIVWEWHAWDHLIQDLDNTKDNFGDVTSNPQRIDINHFTNDGRPNFLHINAIDYHEDRRQILVSVPYFNEVWVLDHSTTTAQAAGTNGGLGNKGGDLMYRWGNDRTFTRDVTDPQYLFFQHDVQWVDDFVSPMNPYFDKIAVFNNRVGDDYSTINVFAPPWDMYSNAYTPNADKSYGPTVFDVSLEHPDKTEIYSTGLSSVQLLPNDNFLITAGRTGRTFEITPNQEVVWEYTTPIRGGARIDQGSVLVVNDNLTFRMKRYPTDFGAFTGRDLTSKGWIETNPNEGYCNLLLPTSKFENDYDLNIFPNPANEKLIIEWIGETYVFLEIFDILGRRQSSWRATGGKQYIELSDWNEGQYFIRINGRYSTSFIVKH